MPGLKVAPLPKALAPAAPKAAPAKLPATPKGAKPLPAAKPVSKLANPLHIKAPTPKYGLAPSPITKGLPALPAQRTLTAPALNAAAAHALNVAKAAAVLGKPLTESQFEKNQAAMMQAGRTSNRALQQHVQEAGFDPTLLGKQLIALPITTGQGLLQTGEALGHDLIHPVQTIEHPLHSATFQLGKNIVTHDPVLEDIERGNFSGTEQNPLGTILDATLLGGAALKAADVGMLGDRAASIVSRPDITVPETNFRAARSASTNPLYLAGQHALDYWRDPATAAEGAVKQRANENYFNGTQNMHNASSELNQTVGAAAKSLKKDGTQDLLGHFTILRPHTPAAARDLMQRLHDQWDATLQEHDRAGQPGEPGRLMPEQVKNLKANVKSMDPKRTLTDAQLQRVIDAADKQQEFQASAVAEPKELLGLNAGTQMENRALAPYGQMFENAVHTEDLPGQLLSDRGRAHEDVTRQIGEARKELQALKDSAYDRPMRDIHPDLKDPAKAVKSLENQIKRGGARDELKPLRDARNAARIEFNARRLALRDTASQTVKDLQERQAELRGGHYLHGWVTPVEHGPAGEALERAIASGSPIHGESDLGRHYEPFDFAGAAKRAAERGITPGYLHMSHAEEDALRGVSRGESTTGRGTGGTQAYLGRSFNKGDFAGDTAAAHASQLRGLRQINQAENHERMLQDVGMRNPDGSLRTWGTDPIGVHQAAEDLADYQARTGIPMQLVARHPAAVAEGSEQWNRINALQHAEGMPERYAAVPQAYMDRMQQLAEAQRPAPYVGHLNQLWRGGVLPASANYIQAVPQEGLVRTLLSGINPMRTIIPSKWGARDFNAMLDGLKEQATNPENDPATRAFYAAQHKQFSNLGGAGTTFGQQERDLQELIDAARNDPNKAKAAAAHLERIVYKPGKWQLGNMHKLESVQSKAVLNDWVKDMKKVHGSMEAVVKAVGEGRDATNLAAEAAHHLTSVLGNYIHRGPAELKLIRNYTPFLPWAKNAVKFAYVTLPKDHPLTFSLLTALGIANSRAWQAQHAGLAPYLSQNLFGTNFGTANNTVSGFGGQIDPLRNTPFGVEDTNSPLGTLGSLIMPSVTAPLFGSYGLTSFGTPTKTSTYGVDVQPGSGSALGVLAKNSLGLIPYEGLFSKIITAADGHTAKDAVLSHNHALAVIENALGGSLLPKNYRAYSTGSSSSSSSWSGGSSGGWSGSGSGSW